MSTAKIMQPGVYSICAFNLDATPTPQPDDFLDKCEKEAKDKEDELKFFCKMLNYKDTSKVWTWFKNNTDIIGVKPNPELKSRVLTFLMGFKKHEVDGKIWSNGCFGSRWTDKVDGCRIAFYSRKLDPGMFKDERLTKQYVLMIMNDE